LSDAKIFLPKSKSGCITSPWNIP